MRLLGHDASINVRKVLWTAAELDIPLDRAQSDAQLLARNPNGLVPVLEDAGFVLWESNSICRHLARQHPHAKLLPDDPQLLALTEQWMDWQATELNTAWRYAFMSIVRQSKAHTDAAQVAASVESWNRHMGLLDVHLGADPDRGQFVTGEHFTLADVVIGLSVHRWLHTPMPRPHYDAVHLYYQRLSVRPGARNSRVLEYP